MEIKLSNIIREGDCLNMSTTTKFGGMIRRILGPAYIKANGGICDYNNCPNHDAPVVKVNGQLFIGDCALTSRITDFPWPCRLTPVYQYEQDIAAGRVYAVRVMRIPGLTTGQATVMSNYWISDVQGQPYDIAAMPMLALKAIFGDRTKFTAGWEWAHFCTESFRLETEKAGLKIYNKVNSTPLTTYKRSLAGALECVAYFNGGVTWIK